jgi:hypothetical protein
VSNHSRVDAEALVPSLLLQVMDAFTWGAAFFVHRCVFSVTDVGCWEVRPR